MNTMADTPTRCKDATPEQDEFMANVRMLFDEIGEGEVINGKFQQRFATPCLGDMTKAREHAEKARAILMGCEEHVIVMQSNSRVVYTFIDPPSLM